MPATAILNDLVMTFWWSARFTRTVDAVQTSSTLGPYCTVTLHCVAVLWMTFQWAKMPAIQQYVTGVVAPCTFCQGILQLLWSAEFIRIVYCIMALAFDRQTIKHVLAVTKIA